MVHFPLLGSDRYTLKKKHFIIVEPIEYVLDLKNRKSFQYIPILKSLQQILSCETLLDKNLMKAHHQVKLEKILYRSFYNCSNYKENVVLSQDCAISLIFYVGHFEICNPVGTSKKKQSLWGVLDIGEFTCQLSLLCHLYIWLPLTIAFNNHLWIWQCVEALDRWSYYIGTAWLVYCYVGENSERLCSLFIKVDNLGAQNIDIQTKEVNSGPYCLRSQEIHTFHLKTVEENSLASHCCLKTRCVLSQNLAFFNET